MSSAKCSDGWRPAAISAARMSGALGTTCSTTRRAPQPRASEHAVLKAARECPEKSVGCRTVLIDMTTSLPNSPPGGNASDMPEEAAALLLAEKGPGRGESR